MFLLDSSGSVGSTNFRKMLDFVKDVVKTFAISPNDVQVGVDTFETQVHSTFNLNRYGSKAAIVNAVGQMGYHSGVTHTGEAIRFLHTNSFATSSGKNFRYSIYKYAACSKN